MPFSTESQMLQILQPSQIYSQRVMATSDPLLSDPPIIKKRRGRQPRQSLLTSSLRASITRFTSTVGAPVLQPAGFRDFNGWLHTIAQPTYKNAWISLCHSFIIESTNVSTKNISTLKRDVIHEIINNVVKRKSHESIKLVSTNARRQSCIPPSGNTVMTIFESYLSTVSSSTIIPRSAPYSSHNNRHEKLNHSSGSSDSPYGCYSPSFIHPHQSNQSRHQSPSKSPSTSTNSASHNVSIASLSSKSSKSSSKTSSKTSSDSPRVIASSTMDISSLLTDGYSDIVSHKDSNHSNRNRSHHNSHSSHNSHNSHKYASNIRSKLPSLSQLDEHLRERSEKERKYY